MTDYQEILSKNDFLTASKVSTCVNGFCVVKILGDAQETKDDAKDWRKFDMQVFNETLGKEQTLSLFRSSFIDLLKALRTTKSEEFIDKRVKISTKVSTSKGGKIFSEYVFEAL